MDTVVITRRVCLHSRYLTSRLNDHLMKELVKVTRNECGKENGHILQVKEIIKIKDQKISRVNTDNVFTVVFKAVTLNPVVGTDIEGEVCMIYKDGIFINVLNRQKILVPSSMIENYEFDDNENVYVKGPKTIGMSDRVKIEITASQYKKGGFSCIAIFKDL